MCVRVLAVTVFYFVQKRPPVGTASKDVCACFSRQISSDGFHEAEALLLGKHMSSCTLTLMRANQEKGAFEVECVASFGSTVCAHILEHLNVRYVPT